MDKKLSDNFRFVNANNGTRSKNSSTLVISTSTWYKAKIIHRGNSVDYEIDGVNIGNEADNIPLGPQREVGITFHCEAGIGGTFMALDIDYVKVWNPEIVR